MHNGLKLQSSALFFSVLALGNRLSLLSIETVEDPRTYFLLVAITKEMGDISTPRVVLDW